MVFYRIISVVLGLKVNSISQKDFKEKSNKMDSHFNFLSMARASPPVEIKNISIVNKLTILEPPLVIDNNED